MGQSNAMPLRPDLEEIVRLADDAKATAQATLDGMSDAQLAWSPGKDRWSAAMIADHLVRSNDAVRVKFEAALESAPPNDGEGPTRFNLIERQMIRAMSPGTSVRVPVPPMFEPQPPADPRAAVAAFFASHEALVEIARRADAYRLDGIKITSPASPLFRFRLVPYLHALFQHERYHLEQVKALIEEPGFPRG
jgi:hypothetical protein